MPGFDGTGPQDTGPMTGHGRGYCMGYVAAGLPSRTGWAPGYRPVVAAFVPTASGQHELNFFKEQASYLEKALEEVKKRIKELESKE